MKLNCFGSAVRTIFVLYWNKNLKLCDMNIEYYLCHAEIKM